MSNIVPTVQNARSESQVQVSSVMITRQTRVSTECDVLTQYHKDLDGVEGEAGGESGDHEGKEGDAQSDQNESEKQC
jgi:hypothetical protein